jgi:4-hydroxybenzoate polyprenyltransferase/phosphoserine phosphatase
MADLTADRPLVVDIDGTLAKTDLLAESFFALLSANPLTALAALGSLRGGKAALKRHLAERAALDVAYIPLHETLVAYLQEEKRKGRRIYLASAADRRYVEALAERLGLFDGLFASDGAHNLKSDRKAQALVEAFGEKGFDYVGNDYADLAVWRAAAEVYVVDAPARLVRKVRQEFPHATILIPTRPRLGSYLRALRPHQWLKNLLIFVPLLAAHDFTVPDLLSEALAFVIFSLCASSVYLLNDLFDLRSDREHPSKRNRPFAAGDISLAKGALLLILALAAAAAGSLALPGRFIAVLGFYYATTLGYSMLFKRVAMLDVVVLACLYTLRLLAGGAAGSVPLSPWLICFSIFIFLSLALIKRCAELIDRQTRGKGDPVGRGYKLTDIPQLQILAASAGYVAAMVFGLYITHPAVVLLYGHFNRLWGIPVVLLYWISRVSMLTHRGEMHEDPVIFAAKDRISLACLGLILLVAIVSL